MFVYERGQQSDSENPYVRLCVYGCVHLSKCINRVRLCLYIIVFVIHSTRYNSEGRVTNITLPTGEVSGFHSNLERWSRVEVEVSNRENFITSTNLSASDTIYTFRQGIPPCFSSLLIVSRNIGKQSLDMGTQM